MTTQIDQVRLALSRILKIKLSHIGQWRIECGQDAYRAFGASSSHFPGMLEAEMTVYFSLENYICQLLKDKSNTSVICEQFTIEDRYTIRANLRFFYGKETQHVFKALSQMFVYRKPAKKRRK